MIIAGSWIELQRSRKLMIIPKIMIIREYAGVPRRPDREPHRIGIGP